MNLNTNIEQRDANVTGRTNSKPTARAAWTRLLAPVVASMMAGAAGVGCAGRPSMIPNSDRALRKTSTQFAADAAKRSYEAEAPRGGEAAARAEVDYTIKEVRLVNLSPDDWHDVEVWVNQRWVVSLPVIPKQEQKTQGYRKINFQMLYDREGNYFPVALLNSKVRVEKVEVCHDGKMYDVPVALAD